MREISSGDIDQIVGKIDASPTLAPRKKTVAESPVGTAKIKQYIVRGEFEAAHDRFDQHRNLGFVDRLAANRPSDLAPEIRRISAAGASLDGLIDLAT